MAPAAPASVFGAERFHGISRNGPPRYDPDHAEGEREQDTRTKQMHGRRGRHPVELRGQGSVEEHNAGGAGEAAGEGAGGGAPSGLPEEPRRGSTEGGPNRLLPPPAPQLLHHTDS